MIGTKTNNIWTNLETEEILSRFNDRDVKITHSGYHRVSLFKSDDQSIVKDTWVDLNFDNEVFLSNEVGEFIFLPKCEFDKLIDYKLDTKAFDDFREVLGYTLSEALRVFMKADWNKYHSKES